MQRKLAQHLAAGAPVRVLRSGDTIEGAGPLAGFSALVESLFTGQR